MATSQDDVIARVRRMRAVQLPQQHDTLGNVQEQLSVTRKFLQDHETGSINDSTHTVIENYLDWWCGQKPTYRLAIAEDNTLDLLYSHIAKCYQLNIPLTLAEKRSEEIKFVQDIAILGTQEESVPVTDIVSKDSPFMKLLAESMGEVYPTHEILDVFIYDTTGSSLKGVKTTSVRLVWPAIIVDRERASRIADFVGHKFKSKMQEEADSPIKTLLNRLVEHNKENANGNVFNTDVYTGNNRTDVRMPLNDIVSKAPLCKPQERPYAPLDVLRCNFDKETKTFKGIEAVLSDLNSLSLEEFVKLGCIRCARGTPLTEWTQPVWKGERATALRTGPRANNGNNGHAGAFMGGNKSGKVAVRTNDGSDKPIATRPRAGQPGAPVRDENTLNSELQFEGTKDDFKEKLRQKMGDSGKITEDGDTVIWRREGEGTDGAKITFQERRKRIFISAKVMAMRALRVAFADCTSEVGGAARSVVSQAQTRTGYAHSSAGQSRVAPSAVYAKAPSNNGASVSGRSNAFSSSSIANGGLPEFKQHYRRVTTDFVAEDDGELAVSKGDLVFIVTDDRTDGCDANRWVEVRLKAADSEKTGYIPLSYASEEVPEEVAEQEIAALVGEEKEEAPVN
eukprot:TRINITY_DN15349_c0_g1_i1.p1 TRINITY_DN15349_c0_g1~~TRINITY_DN15349_c0_g1_i1.p1  ORF type:complete len:623 (-),score=151.82 TRINITY_DN15349_c0_g1_i1:217-2085(-)